MPVWAKPVNRAMNFPPPRGPDGAHRAGALTATEIRSRSNFAMLARGDGNPKELISHLKDARTTY
ncbi:hypothetical protein NicSoilB8_09800 [Arthrobacter sp. NicSoilB8]|nr:hypothetical protein NicSoilB8_09800 [Arthrobacter sp. NicSoilB8]